MHSDANKHPERERTFSTGQVAAICSVRPAMVAKWAREGKLGTRPRANSRVHNRIPYDVLEKFLVDTGRDEALARLRERGSEHEVRAGVLLDALREIRDAKPGNSRLGPAVEDPVGFARRIRAIAACALDYGRGAGR